MISSSPILEALCFHLPSRQNTYNTRYASAIVTKEMMIPHNDIDAQRSYQPVQQALYIYSADGLAQRPVQPLALS